MYCPTTALRQTVKAGAFTAAYAGRSVAARGLVECDTIEIMARIKLSSGREVSIARIDIENIYSGVLEGTPEMVAKMERRFLRESIKKRFWDTEALLIIDAQEPMLPQYRCVAHFHSSPVKPDNYYSTLIACWFIEDINVNLQSAAKHVLDSIDWDAHAEDTHIDDL